MNLEHVVPIESLCIHYALEPTFFKHLTEYGLIEIITNDEIPYISIEQVSEVEKIIRIYHELHVNMEGIDIVFNLLKKIVELQDELARTRNRLSLYEDS